MNISLPVHRGRISPLFDTALRAVVLGVCRGRVVSRSTLELPGTSPIEQIRSLTAADVHALVCGAISRAAMFELLRHQIRVWPGVAGDVDSVIESLLRLGVPGEALRMPGCRGRRHGRRDRWRWGWQSPASRAGRGDRVDF
ncbi:MAG: NifB/NifX family molybdenum-iron cluster-binding protein [Planctomycetota bacterium]